MQTDLSDDLRQEDFRFNSNQWKLSVEENSLLVGAWYGPESGKDLVRQWFYKRARLNSGHCFFLELNQTPADSEALAQKLSDQWTESGHGALSQLPECDEQDDPFLLVARQILAESSTNTIDGLEVFIDIGDEAESWCQWLEDLSKFNAPESLAIAICCIEGVHQKLISWCQEHPTISAMLPFRNTAGQKQEYLDDLSGGNHDDGTRYSLMLSQLMSLDAINPEASMAKLGLLSSASKPVLANLEPEKDISFLIFLGMKANELGFNELATGYYQEAIGKIETISNPSDTILDLHFTCLLSLGNIQLNSGDSHGAIGFFSTITDDLNDSISPERVVEAYKLILISYIIEKNFKSMWGVARDILEFRQSCEGSSDKSMDLEGVCQILKEAHQTQSGLVKNHPKILDDLTVEASQI